MTLGKAAYEAFAVAMNGYDAGFRFEGLSDKGKACWEVAAQAVITEDARQASEIAHANGTQDCHSCLE